MDCKIKIIPRLLHFKQSAGTSRGTYSTRKVWYLHFTSSEFPGRVGIGECAPLPALSCDDLPDYEDILGAACREVEKQNGRLDVGALRKYPSILSDLKPPSVTIIREIGLCGIPLSLAEKQGFLLTALSGWVTSIKCWRR